MKKLIFLLLASFSLTTFAQIPISQEFDKLWEDYRFVKNTEKETEATYKGTPYLTAEDNTCAIILPNEQKIPGLNIRYNAYQDQMEIKRDDQFFVIPKQKELPYFILGNIHFKYLIYTEGKSKKTGYLELLTEGPCSLYRQYSKVLIDAEKAKPYQEAKPATFKDNSPEYFISIKNDYPVKINNIKELMGLVPEHSAEMKAYIKTNKLKFKKQEHLIQIIDYYNSL